MVLHFRVAVVRFYLSKRLSSRAPHAEVVQAEKLTKLAQLQQPTNLMQNLPSRTEITGAGSIVVKDRVSQKPVLLWLALSLYVVYGYFLYKSYRRLLVINARVDCSEEQFLKIMNGENDDFKNIFKFVSSCSSITDTDGFSVFHWIAANNRVDLAKALVASGNSGTCGNSEDLSINACQTRPSGFSFIAYMSPVLLFQTCFSREQASSILNLSYFKNLTPLHLAAWTDSRDMLDWLLEQKDINLLATAGDSVDALGMALKQENMVSANLIKEKLISVKKFDVNMRTAQGYTRLHHAISDGAFKSAKFLVENGADVLALGPGGETAVGMAEALVYQMRRDEQRDSSRMLILNYLEGYLEKKGLLPKTSFKN